MTIPARFDDRRHAGKALAAALHEFWPANAVVLALPRGGVPVAYEVAEAYRAPLEVLLARKIGAPGHEEYALGAVVDGAEPQWVRDPDMLRQFQPPAGWFEEKMQRQLREIERRRQLYCGAEPPTSLRERAVVLIDDGIATGSTVRVALLALRRLDVSRLVLAVPVAPATTLEVLRPLVDELICLSTPEPFRAVGLHYRNFEQTTDQEVVELLQSARAWVDPARRATLTPDDKED